MFFQILFNSMYELASHLCVVYGVRYWLCRTFYGVLMGAGLFLVILSFQTAVFWGQYSGCQPLQWGSQWTGTVECRQRDAMISACVFAVLMLLSLLLQLGVLFMYKEQILGNKPLDEGLGTYEPIAPASAAQVIHTAHDYKRSLSKPLSTSVDL
jgi:hypothetical protein